jgi:hypothetical protein
MSHIGEKGLGKHVMERVDASKEVPWSAGFSPESAD